MQHKVRRGFTAHSERTTHPHLANPSSNVGLSSDLSFSRPTRDVIHLQRNGGGTATEETARNNHKSEQPRAG